MINSFSLLFSLVAVCFVVIRAAVLDKTLPWYSPISPVMMARGKKRKGPLR